MFSEQKKSEADMSGKKRNDSKEVPFDSLDEKLQAGIAKLNVKEGKSGKKYTPVEDEKRKLLKDKTSSSSLVLQGSSKQATTRSTSLEKADGVGYGLFEAVSLVSNIVDITKDSTLRRRMTETGPPGPNMTKHSKASSKSSLSSQSSQSGPFASLKENAQKKKKSVDDQDSD